MSEESTEPAQSDPAEAVVPRYHYHLELPEYVDLLLQDVTIPDEVRSGHFNPRRQIRVPCSDLLWGPSPTIPSQLLARLCPLDVEAARLRGRRLAVNPQKVATRYRLREVREPVAGPEPPATPPSDTASPAVVENDPTTRTEAPTPADPPAGADTSEPQPTAPRTGADPPKADPARPDPEIPPVRPPAGPPPATSSSILKNLPSLTRKEPAKQQIQLPPSPRRGGMQCEEELQELWVTEESLDIASLLTRCTDLPGISTCILAKGTEILGKTNTPEGLDLLALTSNAAAMIDGMRQSADKMGLGGVTAVTIHSEKGPVSVFHSGGLSLLTLHEDRGFVPGVRERLGKTLDILSGEPRLALPPTASNE